jgi:competence protein ComEC
MIKSCLSLLAGAYALHFTSFVSNYVLLPAAVFGAAVAFLAGGRWAAAWFTAGFALFALHALHVVGLRLPPQFEGDSILTVLQVIDFPRHRGGMISFVARPVDDARIPPRVRLNWFEAGEPLQVGDVWQLEIRLRRPRGTSNPGVFDYEAWLFRERVGATGYVVNGQRNKRGITAEQWLRYSKSGTSHLMAISGLHVGLAATAAWFLVVAGCALLRLGSNHLKIAWVASLLMAAGYACLSGFAVPARRATLMLSLLVLALLLSREPRPFVILAAACFLIVALDPLVTLAPGFQLSFAAVLLLLWFARRQALTSNRSRVARLVHGTVQLAAVQVFLLFGLLPLTVTNFGRVSFVAPLVNFVAVPLFSVSTVPLALAGVLLDGPLTVAGDIALRTSGASIELLQWIIDRALAIPNSAVSTTLIDGFGGLYLATFLAWVALPRAWPGRHAALLAMLALVADRVEGPPDACVDVRMLDVGQGLAVVLRTRQRTMLYDTGAAYRGGSDMATRAVLPYLSAQGTRKIDRLVVSHSDIDHSGGTAAVLAGIEVERVLAGEPDTMTAGRITGCRRGQAWRWDGVAFRVLHPSRNAGHSGNDASCVILVEAGDARLLLTGDIESGVERALVASGVLGGVDAAIVPHHGSNTSSSMAFVRAVSADVVLVSAGYRNRWGLPRPAVVKRWLDSGAIVLETARDGAIGFRLCDRAGLLRLSRHRLQSRRLWHEPPVR